MGCQSAVMIGQKENLSSGFTLVEIMIVVVIIGILATLGLPAFRQVRTNSQVTRFYQDVRVFASAADVYMLETGASPWDATWATGTTLNAPLDEYIKASDWADSPPIGGIYAWMTDSTKFFGVGADGYTMTNEQLGVAEEKWDDQNLATGNLRTDEDGYYYVIID